MNKNLQELAESLGWKRDPEKKKARTKKKMTPEEDLEGWLESEHDIKFVLGKDVMDFCYCGWKCLGKRTSLYMGFSWKFPEKHDDFLEGALRWLQEGCPDKPYKTLTWKYAVYGAAEEK